MDITEQELSKWEFCPAYPTVAGQVEPPRLPVREALRRHFLEAVKLISQRVVLAPDLAESNWKLDAANRGFVYPESMESYVYQMAMDCGSWLAGVVHLIEELGLSLRPIPPVRFGSHAVKLQSVYREGPNLHVFRMADRFQDRLRWPELICMTPEAATALRSDVASISIHTFKLPAFRQGRVPSPLCLAYEHPSVSKQYRLARFDSSGRATGQFSASWKRRGRWEIPDCTWEEWREGIDRDKCLDDTYVCTPATIRTDPEFLDSVARQVAYIAGRMNDAWVGLHFESCATCEYAGWCHGNNSERSQYITIGEAHAEREASRENFAVSG